MEWFLGVFSGSGLLPPGACGMEGGGEMLTRRVVFVATRRVIVG